MGRAFRLSSIIVFALLAGLTLRGQTPSAEAHAWLERSQPNSGEVVQAAPPEILMWFSEEIDVKFSHAQVLNSSGERVDNDDLHDHGDTSNPGITLQINVPDGTYTVVWDVLSIVDGHRTKGSFSYFVGAPDSAPPVEGDGLGISLSSGPPKWLEVLARWLSFAAMALLIGAAAAPFLLLPAGFSVLPRTGDEDAEAELSSAALARVSALGASVLVVLTSVLLLWLQAWSASGSATSLSAVGDVLSGARFGDIWFVRITLAGVALLFSMLSLGPREPPWWRSILAGPNTAWLAVLLAALTIPVTTSMNSHAAVEGTATLQTMVDWLHLAAGGIWIGALVQLLLAAVLIAPYVSDRAAFLGGLVRQFSLVALPAVSVIVGTGIVQSIHRLGGVDELVDSDYGYTLLAKVLLLLPLVALGALNLLVIGPRFLRFARDRAQELLARLPALEGRFRLAVAAEVTLAAAILVVTAILTNTSPPRGEAGPLTQGTITTTSPTGRALGSKIVDDLNITVWADPGAPGVNEVNVLLNDLNGDWKNVQKLLVRFKSLDQDLGESEEEARPIHPPVHFIATTTQMSLAGKWQIEVIVRREGLLDTRAEIPIQIGAAAATPSTPAS
ncbi:MAG TPA: copper resistance protein CopC [Dehalococcoidia bacterium]|nr:copper resistance protein CopC [Dehalococcoidia bacterium]